MAADALLLLRTKAAPVLRYGLLNPGQEFYYRIVVEAAGIASADSEEGRQLIQGNVPGTEKFRKLIRQPEPGDHRM